MINQDKNKNSESLQKDNHNLNEFDSECDSEISSNSKLGVYDNSNIENNEILMKNDNNLDLEANLYKFKNNLENFLNDNF